MKLSSILLGGIFAATTIASPTTNHVQHERRDVSNPRWEKRKALDADTKIPVRIALKQQNLGKGEEHLLEISDPDSAKYGQHLTQDEIVEMFAPDATSISAVKEWLVSAGVSSNSIVIPKSRAWIQADATAAQLESILKTKYYTYSNVHSREEHIGTDSYHLPRDISEIVEFITPGTVFSPKKRGLEARTDKAIGAKFRPMPPSVAQKLTQNPEALDTCGTAITPACIKAMYKIPDATLHDSSNTLGIFEISDEKYNQKDLNQFYKAAATYVPAGTATKADLIDGATATGPQSSAGGEITLDLDIAIPLIYPQTTTLFQTVVAANDIFNTFLDAVDGSYCTYDGGDDPDVDGTVPNEMCGTFKPANVISFSYGYDEADYPTHYLTRQCHEFMKLGLQGVTLVMSSGDDGVARRGGSCLGPNEDIFTPDTAANCPYITVAGATTLPSGKHAGDEETATTSFSSGGGFSNVFLTPDYQKTAVSQYFTAHDPGYKYYSTSNGTIPTTGGIYNRAGRGYPDMAAVGDNGVVVVGGQKGLSGGTSMSSPLIAAIFTRINDERLAAGKGLVGFVNPVLYKNPQMFHDITVGNQDKGGPNGEFSAERVRKRWLLGGVRLGSCYGVRNA